MEDLPDQATNATPQLSTSSNPPIEEEREEAMMKPDGPLIEMIRCPRCGSVFVEHDCPVPDVPVQLALF